MFAYSSRGAALCVLITLLVASLDVQLAAADARTAAGPASQAGGANPTGGPALPGGSNGNKPPPAQAVNTTKIQPQPSQGTTPPPEQAVKPNPTAPPVPSSTSPPPPASSAVIPPVQESGDRKTAAAPKEEPKVPSSQSSAGPSNTNSSPTAVKPPGFLEQPLLQVAAIAQQTSQAVLNSPGTLQSAITGNTPASAMPANAKNSPVVPANSPRNVPQSIPVKQPEPAEKEAQNKSKEAQEKKQEAPKHTSNVTPPSSEVPATGTNSSQGNGAQVNSTQVTPSKPQEPTPNAVPGPTAPPASTKPVDSQGAATPADTTQVKLLKGTQVNLHKGLYLNIDVPVIKCLQTLAQAQQYLEVGSEPAIDTEMRRVQVLQDLSATLPADTVAYLVPGTQQDPNITLLQLREGSKLQIPTALFAQGPAQTANVSSPAPGGRRLLADPNTEVEVKLADNVTFSVNASVEALTNTPNLPVVLTSPPLTSSPPAGGPNPGVIAGAVVGTVGGLAILGLVAALLILRRRRQYRSTYAHPITGSTASPDLEKDVMFAGGVDQVHSDSEKTQKPARGVDAGAAAGAVATVVDVGALMGGAAAARGAMEPGFTGDELHAGLSDLKYIVTNKLQPAVEASPLGPDVVATWLDAGIENVRSVLPSGESDYTASHSFVEDWRTHRAWNWLNSSIWRFIPTNQQLLAVQAPADIMSSRTRYARYVLDRIQRDPDLPALKSTVSNAASALVAEAAAQARSSGISVSAGDVEAAAGYYRPVVMQLCEAALRFHLQVQGTADTTLVYVPGASKPLAVSVPAEALVCKSRSGGVVPCCLCERPGILGVQAPGVDVWVPADAVNITPL